MVYSLIFWVLAAISNAVMDTLKYHYYTSIFFQKFGNNPFWNEDLEDAKPYIIPGTKYKVNAWHLFKSGMIIFQALSIISAWVYGPPLLNIWWFYLAGLIWLGILWNGVFNIFYNHLLIRK